jgi:hypothetical protein
MKISRLLDGGGPIFGLQITNIECTYTFFSQTTRNVHFEELLHKHTTLKHKEKKIMLTSGRRMPKMLESV